jgi:hypothetical protein
MFGSTSTTNNASSSGDSNLNISSLNNNNNDSMNKLGSHLLKSNPISKSMRNLANLKEIGGGGGVPNK